MHNLLFSHETSIHNQLTHNLVIDRLKNYYIATIIFIIALFVLSLTMFLFL